MKFNLTLRAFALPILIFLFSIFFSFTGFSQQTLTTINGWNAYVHLPDDYNSTGSQTYPLIVFFPGTGEVGSNASLVLNYGPGHFIASGWNGNVVVNGVTVKPIIISLQPPAVWPALSEVDLRLQAIKSMYRVDPNRISLTGLSMGGWASEIYVQSNPTSIASVVAIQAVRPDDNPAYPAPFATYAKDCGHWLGYEQVNDPRDMSTIYNTMNTAVAGSATYFLTNVGGGGHCCWNTWYDPTHTDNYSLNGVTGNWSIYQYMLTWDRSKCSPGNVAPTVNAGAAQNITLPTSSITLTGTATGNNGATISSVAWSQVSGGAAVITSPTSLSTTVTGLAAGTYTFKLTVTDNNGLTNTSTVTVTVNALSTPPTVAAGSPQTITLPTNTVTLTGTATANGGATISSVAWSEVSGGAATITSASNLSTTVTGLVAGTYTFKLTATDNNGLTSSSNVTVTVNAANLPPTVNAGLAQTITLPISTVTLTGTATGNNGASISSVKWTQVSGGPAVIVSIANLSTVITGLLAGAYTFQLSATDNNGLTSTSNVTVTVNAALNPSNPCGCDIIIKPSPTDGTAYLDGNTLGVKPGNKVCLMAGHYIDISLTHFSGAPGNPVTIVNCGGLVTVSGYNAYGFGLHTSRYVHVTGSGDPAYKYGILIDGSVANTSVGFAEDMQVSDVELDHIEVSKAGEAVACEPTPSCDPFTWGSSWKMYNMSFHDNYIHDTFFEGFYIGNTQNDYNYTCSGTAVTVHPVQFDTVKFYNNIIDKAGWTGAQISEVVGFLDCHDNVFTNYGYLNKSQHQAGLIVGGNSHGNVYRNKIIGGTGNAFECFAAGLTKVYNNIFANAGFDGSAEGQNAVLIDDRPRFPSNLPPLQIYFINNTIVNAARVAITFYNDYGTVGTGNIIANNLISAPGYYKVFPNLAFLYMQSGMSVTVSNNIYAPTNAEVNYADAVNNNFHLLSNSPAVDAGIDVSAYGVTSDYDNIPRPYGAAFDVGAFEYNSGNQPPVAKVGAKQTITLPTTSAPLDGSKSYDPDGTIASYTWTQTSGPSGSTIASPSSATTTVSGLMAGTYVFKLTVTDNKGATGSALDTIVVNALVNQPPVANAGADQTITLPVNTVTVDGSASKDPNGTINSYGWSQISGPSTATIANASTVSTAINNLIQGTYVFKLIVTDNNGATGTDSITIHVNAAANQSPIANAGSSQTITLPTNSANLDGSKSSDPDGTIASYSWAQISGPSTATITNGNTATPNVSGLQAGQYIFELTVTDNKGATGKAQVKITVVSPANQAPIANAGASQTITLPTNSISLDGTKSSDPDGTIVSYSWAQISGPSTAVITGGNTATPSISGLQAGVYIFELTVTDNIGATGKAQVKITVAPPANVAPIANAGADQTITLPTNIVNVDGSASQAPSGSIVSYAWAQVSGPSTASVTNASSVTTAINNLVQGTYVFSLTVTDNNNATATDQVTIHVNAPVNQSPIANAGADQNITLPANSVTVDGGASKDPDGTITAYAWSQVSGPSTATIANASGVTTAINNLVQGTYVFKLVVTDNSGATASDIVTIKVNAAANQAPVANAGTGQTITLPTNSVNLDGSKSYDPDGTIASYGWAQVSGPSTATIAAGNTATPTVSGLLSGQYVFELTVTDNSGATGKAQVKITVSASINQPPVANAGLTQTITYPANSIILDGTKSYDADGTIVSYSWAKISGPGSVNIVNGNTPTATASGLQPGQYIFELTVTDNKGASATDQVTIIVKSATGNQLPVANAGPDQSILLPLNTANLDGSKSSDPDGSIASYAWVEVSGPSTATINNGNTATPIVSGLKAGKYVFQLTVTDNIGATAQDQVTITVSNPVSTGMQLIANAGRDTTIVIPATSTTLDGSASTDIGGTITSYEWSQVNGPAPATIASSNGVSTTVNDLIAGQYIFQLTVTDNSGNTATDTVQVTVVNTLKSLEQIILYPNPAQSIVNLRLISDSLGTVRVNIYDMTGRLVFAQESDKEQSFYDKSMNISRLSKGMYTVQVLIGINKTMVAKLVKQ